MNATSIDLSVNTDTRIALARSHFFRGDPVPRGAVGDAIERSWTRCATLGLSPSTPANLSPVTARELRELRERSSLLLEVAQPELENLYQQIAQTRGVGVVYDQHFGP